MAKKSKEEWKTYNSVFDNFTNRLLFKLASQGYFEDLISTIGPGKEAVVFSATSKDGDVKAVKIYRLETANFKKMFDYLRVDPRFTKLGRNTVGDPRRRTIFGWTEREYRNLLLARECGVRVPMPIAHQHNVLVMEFIGHGKEPSPLLKHSPPDDPVEFAEQCFEFIERYAKAGMVHGDLSEYNIINHDEEPVFIDFSHAVPLKAPNSPQLLERDVTILCAYFRKLGVKVDEKDILARALGK